jgi:chromosome partitioning protein
MRTIALTNQKGGVGKTTTAVHLAAGLARLGRRTLLIDMDPQANATLAFGLAPHTLENTSYDLLAGRTTVAAAARAIEPGLWLLPSNLNLAGAELELTSAIGREHVLRDRMEAAAEYDFVLVDLPPSLGLLNVNALAYCREVFIPMQCEYFALHGLSLLLKTLHTVKRRLNPELHVGGVVACMYDARKSLARETVEELRRHFGDTFFKTVIRANVRLAEAPSHGKTVFDHAPDSHGAEDYLALAREVAEQAAAGPEAVRAAG